MKCSHVGKLLQYWLFSLMCRLGGCHGGFLLISSPQEQTVMYARLLTAAEMARGDKMNAITLAKAGQLQEPLGLAADGLRGLVYVADPTAGAVFVLRTYQSGGLRSTLSAEEPRALVTGLAPRWLAVDATGNLLVTDVNKGRIITFPASLAMDIATGAESTLEADSPAIASLYDSAALQSSPKLQDPQGVATDGSNVYWANGAGGTSDGSVVQAPQDQDDPNRAQAAAALANNAEATTGLCLSGSRIFFTDGATNLFSIPTGGGSVTTVNSGLTQGQGCAYDGDGTVFIADQADGRVYSIAGKGSTVESRPLSLALEVKDAAGVAVMFSASWRMPAGWGALAAALLVCLQTL
eukprot:TRINITY_DN11975_c0_g1_i1.p1 TRINITY_DN11975_c0_g1~~TRINITY_DN11975_c0_g1_i1.p1  ORF type:complete len:352 (-),score=64.13 TRINITY_DN11975_c0_g1_i1:113-1168(-)